MPVFWKKSREPRWHPSNPDFDGSPRPPAVDKRPPPVGAVFDEGDWEKLDQLLASERPLVVPGPKRRVSVTLASPLSQLRDLSMTNQNPAGWGHDRPIARPMGRCA